MPEAAKQEAPAAETKTENHPPVIDLALFEKLRTIQALRNSGVITDDQQQSDVQLLKRINHALHADYSNNDLPSEVKDAMAGMQKQFQQMLAGKPYAELVQDGKVNRLLDDYLGLLVEAAQKKLAHLETGALKGEETDPASFNDMRDAAKANIKKYNAEREYYKSEYGAQMIKDVAGKYEEVVKNPAYLPTGKIVALSGVSGKDTEFTLDQVNDVMGVQSARWFKTTLTQFVDDAALERYAADPIANAVRIKAMSEVIAHNTSPLSSLGEFQAESVELDRIETLKTLVSAQLHYAMQQDREPAERATVERAARKHLQEAAQVALSLSYDYLAMGPAKDDAITKTIQGNLKKEMERDGIVPLPVDQAIAKAAELARKSAEDLLVLPAVQEDAKLASKIEALAAAAGVPAAEQKLEAKSQLIGKDMRTVIKEALRDSKVIVPKKVEWAKYIEETKTKGADVGLAS